MLNKIKKGSLNPCPVCGSSDYIDWSGYRYISLACNNCGFEMYPENDFASEQEYFEEWNNLKKIDTLIENQDRLITYIYEQIELANKVVKECEEKKAHLIWTKQRIDKAKENLPVTLGTYKPVYIHWLFFCLYNFGNLSNIHGKKFLHIYSYNTV